MLPQLAAVLDAESQLRLGILFEAAKVGRGHSACCSCGVLRCAASCCVVQKVQHALVPEP